jgi:hypothetical protein
MHNLLAMLGVERIAKCEFNSSFGRGANGGGSSAAESGLVVLTNQWADLFGFKCISQW